MDEIEVKLVRLCPKCGPTTEYSPDLKCTVCGQYTKEEVIAGDMGGMMPPPPPITTFEQTERVTSKKRMCAQYSKEIDANARFCQYCGIAIPDGRISESTITGLAAIGGILGIHGLGHIVIGRMAFGFMALFAGWALLAGITLSYFKGWIENGETAYLALIGILAVAYILLFIWQVIDAHESAKKQNRNYENHKAS